MAESAAGARPLGTLRVASLRRGGALTEGRRWGIGIWLQQWYRGLMVLGAYATLRAVYES